MSTQKGEAMWWWKVALHLDEAQLALANAMAHNLDDPGLALGLQERLREGQASLLEIFGAKGLLPAQSSGAPAAAPPAMPVEVSPGASGGGPPSFAGGVPSGAPLPPSWIPQFSQGAFPSTSMQPQVPPPPPSWIPQFPQGAGAIVAATLGGSVVSESEEPQPQPLPVIDPSEPVVEAAAVVVVAAPSEDPASLLGGSQADDSVVVEASPSEASIAVPLLSEGPSSEVPVAEA